MIDTLDTSSPTLTVPPRMALLFNALAAGAITAATLLPFISVVFWLSVGTEDAASMAGLPQASLPDITMVQRLVASLVALVVTLPMAWGLVRLRACLVSLADGRPFTPSGVAGLRDFALGGMLAALAKLIGHTSMALVLTWNAEPGQRQLLLRIDSDMLLLAMFAGTVAALAWAMEQAAILAEENSQFV